MQIQIYLIGRFCLLFIHQLSLRLLFYNMRIFSPTTPMSTTSFLQIAKQQLLVSHKTLTHHHPSHFFFRSKISKQQTSLDHPHQLRGVERTFETAPSRSAFRDSIKGDLAQTKPGSSPTQEAFYGWSSNSRTRPSVPPLYQRTEPGDLVLSIPLSLRKRDTATTILSERQQNPLRIRRSG